MNVLSSIFLSSLTNPITLSFLAVIGVLLFYEIIRHLFFNLLRIGWCFAGARKKLTEASIGKSENTQANSAKIVQAAELFGRSKTNSKFRRLWSGFIDSWLQSIPQGRSNPVGAVSVYSVFEVEEILGGATVVRKLESIPGRLMSLGILGTFVGLTYGFYSIDINPDNMDQVYRSITNLISGLSVAFVTSIVGIIAALVFMFSEKWSYSFAAKCVEVFLHEASICYPFQAPETSLLHLSHAADRQLDSLMSLENDLAATLSESFGEAVQEHLAPLIDDIHQTVTEATNITSEVQIEGIQRIVDGFIETMNQQLGANFQEFGDNINKATSNVAELMEGLETSVARQASVMERTASTADVLERQLPHLIAFGEQLDKSSNSLQEVIAGIDKMRASLLASFKEAQETQKQITEKHSYLVESVHKTVQELSATNTSLIASQELMQKLFQESLRSFEAQVREGLKQSLSSFDIVLSDILERFSGTLAEMRDQYEALEQHTISLREGTEAYSSTMTVSLEQIESIFTKSQQDLVNLTNEFIPVLSQNLEQGRKQAANIAKHQEELNKASFKLETNMQALIEELNQIPAKMTNEIEKRTGDFLVAFTKEIRHEIERHNQLLTEVHDLGSQLEKTTSSLGSNFGQMSKSVIDLTNRIAESAKPEEQQKPRRRLSLFGR